MATTNLNISVIEKRMLRASEAAHYTGFAANQFARECPVMPILLSTGAKLWDKRDLDAWLDGLKSGTRGMNDAAILGRL